MLHARKDYNRIQDPHNLIPADEPVFLIRGQDAVAPDVLEYYANLLNTRFRNFEGIDELVEVVKEQAEEMRVWQKTNKIKIPDL